MFNAIQEDMIPEDDSRDSPCGIACGKPKKFPQPFTQMLFQVILLLYVLHTLISTMYGWPSTQNCATRLKLFFRIVKFKFNIEDLGNEKRKY